MQIPPAHALCYPDTYAVKARRQTRQTAEDMPALGDGEDMSVQNLL